MEDCHCRNRNGDGIKTKTKTIIPKISEPSYTRKPESFLIGNKLIARTFIMGRFGMLQCGRNFKGSNNVTCNECGVVDDEEHRLNHCIKYRSLNYYDHEQKVPFKNIFSTDVDILRDIIPRIQKVWDTNCAPGKMKKAEC